MTLPPSASSHPCPAATTWIRPVLRPQPISGTRWPLPHRPHQIPSQQYCGSPALQSQGGPDQTAGQIVQGAGRPTRPTLPASGAQVRRQYQAGDRTSLGTLDQVRLSFHAPPSSYLVGEANKALPGFVRKSMTKPTISALQIQSMFARTIYTTRSSGPS